MNLLLPHCNHRPVSVRLGTGGRARKKVHTAARNAFQMFHRPRKASISGASSTLTVEASKCTIEAFNLSALHCERETVWMLWEFVVRAVAFFTISPLVRRRRKMKRDICLRPVSPAQHRSTTSTNDDRSSPFFPPAAKQIKLNLLKIASL